MPGRFPAIAALLALGLLMSGCGKDPEADTGNAGDDAYNIDVAHLQDAPSTGKDGAAPDKDQGEYVDPKTDRFVLAFGGDFDDQADAVAVGKSGDLFVAGRTLSAGQGAEDALLMRLTSCGEVKWARTYGGKAKDDARGVTDTKDGGAIIAGLSESFGGSAQAWLVKTDGKGEVQWSKAYGGGGHDTGQAVIEVDGGYAVMAETYNFGPGTPESHNMMVFRVGEKGDVVWEKTLGGGVDGDAGFVIRELRDKAGPAGKTAALLLGGATESFSAGHDDAWLIKLAPDGEVVWSKAHGGEQDDELRSMSVLKSGGIVATGFSRSFAAQKSDVFTMRTDADGKLLWWRHYGGKERDRGYAIIPSGEGFLLVGRTASWGFAAGDAEDGFIAGLDQTGKALWWNNLGGKSGEELLAAVALGGDPDKAGIVMVGRSQSFSVNRQRDVWVMRADAKGDTGCGFSDLTMSKLGRGKGKATTGTELPAEATGLTASDANPVAAAVPDIFGWAAHACRLGGCTP